MLRVSRRDIVLDAGGAAVMFGLDRPVALIGTAQAQGVPPGARQFHHYWVGDIEVFSLNEGTIERPLSQGFVMNMPIATVRNALGINGVVPDKYTNPFIVTAIRTGGKVILFDTGFGASGPPTTGKLFGNMRAAGLDPTAVFRVIISHFHPDHIGGLWASDGWAQAFPQAEIWVPEVEYKFWTDPAALDKAPEWYRPTSNWYGAQFQRIQATFPTWTNLKRYSPDAEVAPGVRALATYGHAPGHMSFRLGSGGRQLFLQIDVTGFERLFVRHPGWHSRLDFDPVMAEATRRRFFEQVLAEGGLVAGYHFTFPGVGTLARDGDGYAFEPLTG